MHCIRINRGLALLAAALLTTAEGRAQTAHPAAEIMARELYEQAIEKMKHGDHAAACPMLEEVVRLLPEGVGARLTQASCYERDGRLASAWSAYMDTEAAASRARRRHQQVQAQAQAEALRPRLARLAVILPQEVRALPGLHVTCDDVTLGPAQWDTTFAVDRGAHTIRAIAEGRQTWEARVNVEADGEIGSVEIGELAAIEAAPTPAPAPDGRDAPSPDPQIPALSAAARAAPRDAGSGFWSARRTLGVTLGGAGLLGVTLGTVAGATAIMKRDASDAHCTNNICNQDGFVLRGQSIQAGTISTVAFIVGGLSLVGGAWVFATAPRNETRQGAQVALGPGRIEIRGRW